MARLLSFFVSINVKLSRAAIEARLLGMLDVKNPSAIPQQQVQSWEREGIVSYLGEADDVRPQLAEKH